MHMTIDEKFYPESLSENLVTKSKLKITAATKDMFLPINLATISTDDIFEMGAPKVIAATKAET